MGDDSMVNIGTIYKVRAGAQRHTPDKRAYPSRTSSRSNKFKSVLLHTFLVLVCLGMLYPLYFGWCGDRSYRKIKSFPLATSCRIDLFSITTPRAGRPTPRMLSDVSSSILGSFRYGAVVGNLIACTLAAYAFSRGGFPS